MRRWIRNAVCTVLGGVVLIHSVKAKGRMQITDEDLKSLCREFQAAKKVRDHYEALIASGQLAVLSKGTAVESVMPRSAWVRGNVSWMDPDELKASVLYYATNGMKMTCEQFIDRYTVKEILRFRGIGKKGASEIVEALRRHGYIVRGSSDPA